MRYTNPHLTFVKNGEPKQTVTQWPGLSLTDNQSHSVANSKIQFTDLEMGFRKKY